MDVVVEEGMVVASATEEPVNNSYDHANYLTLSFEARKNLYKTHFFTSTELFVCPLHIRIRTRSYVTYFRRVILVNPFQLPPYLNASALDYLQARCRHFLADENLANNRLADAYRSLGAYANNMRLSRNSDVCQVSPSIHHERSEPETGEGSK